jgi:hypothetical protein
MDLLTRLSGGQLLGLFAITAGVLLMATTTIAGLWARVRRAEFRAREVEAEAALKQDMINRGMSADDIERILTASAIGAKKHSECRELALKR